MQRTLEFRCYNKAEKKHDPDWMPSAESSNDDRDSFIFIPDNGFIVEQYLNRFDIKGNKVFENDVLLVTKADTRFKVIATTEWAEQELWVGKEFEVIGHRFINADLVADQKSV